MACASAAVIAALPCGVQTFRSRAQGEHGLRVGGSSFWAHAICACPFNKFVRSFPMGGDSVFNVTLSFSVKDMDVYR